MFERIKGSAKDDKAKVHADSLKNVFRYLATTGEIDVSDRLGVRTPDGKDVRDDLRSLALKICAGGFKGKGSEGVQQELAPILTKYGVDPVIQQEIKDAFLFMTPEVLAIALEPVSTIDDSNNLVIGSLLPHNLINAQDDRGRWASFQRDFRVDDHADTVEMLSDALGTIYRTKDGTEIDKDSIDYAYEVKLSHQKAEFGQVADTQELKRMRLAAKIAVYKKNGMEIPEELKKAALELNGQESAAPVAEDEGRGIDD